MPRASEAIPEETYSAFATNESMSGIATRFGISKNTLRKWWVAQFGQAALTARGKYNQAESTVRTGAQRRKPIATNGLKECTKCHLEKSLDDFSKSGAQRDGRACWCQVCSREYQQEKKYKRAALKDRRQLIDSLKQSPCMDCGGTFPPVAMDFDHVRGSVSEMVGWHIDRLLDEIAKCDVICSNCHRIRTHQRRLQKETH